MFLKAYAKRSIAPRLSQPRLGTIAATVIGTVFLANASSAAAQASECSRLIELSKLRNETVTDSQSFEQYQRQFCSDYQSYKSSGKAMQAGGSYGPISANFGQSGSSVDSVASRYCDNNGSIRSTADAYRQYVETIAPGAFDSYNNCIQLGNNNIKFTLPPMAIKPTNATFIVNNTDQNTNAFEKIRYNAAPGISCKWDRLATDDVLELKGRSAATLNCSRSSPDQAGYVVMYAATLPNSAVTVPWEQYVDGAPTSIVTQLRAATADLTALTNSLRGAVISFNSLACPPGWSSYVPAQGRFIRGIDPNGDRSIDPDGARAPGNIQVDALKSHTHTHIQMMADNSVDGVDSTGFPSGEHHNEQRSTGATGDAETRPKNVALLYCEHR